MQRHFSLLRGTALVAAFLGTGGLLGAAELPKSPEVAETGKLEAETEKGLKDAIAEFKKIFVVE